MPFYPRKCAAFIIAADVPPPDPFMVKNKKLFPAHPPPDDDNWMTTYADMMTLLLIFFVLLFAISSMNKSLIQGFVDSMSKTFGEKKSNDQIQELIQMRDSLGLQGDIDLDELEDLNKVLDQIGQIVHNQNLEENIEMNIDNRGIVIRASESVFFSSGKADILPPGQRFLYQIHPIISKTDYNIQIEGHTDNIPIRTARFPSNWELSAIRATNVVRFFAEKCNLDPIRFSAMGFGEFHPLVDNESPENRNKNRRVEIIILRSKYK